MAGSDSVPEHFQLRDACPACHSTRLRRLFSRSYGEVHLRRVLESFYSASFRREYGWVEPAEFTLEQCLDCGLLFQKWVPDAFLLRRLYSEWIDPREALRSLHEDTTAGSRLDLARTVFLSMALSGAGSGMRTLDHGCGWGEWAGMARAFGAEACGTELSPERHEYCARRGIGMQLEESLPDGYFDLINVSQVLEHLPDPARTLLRLARSLRPHGIMRVAVPNGMRVAGQLRHFDREIEKPLGGAMHAVAPLQHLNCFTGGSLVALAQRCGLEPVRPPWRTLLQAAALPGGAVRSAIKAVLRPCYLRSRFATDLHFRKRAPGAAAGPIPPAEAAHPTSAEPDRPAVTPPRTGPRRRAAAASPAPPRPVRS